MSGMRGSEWRGWDLHVHTPASIEHNYVGGTTEEVWDRYLSELEALPAHIRVLGINDYWTLDGFVRLRLEKQAGRLQNIEALFPVIEMRLGEFGGTGSKLSRANLHAIFDPDLDPNVIQAQFLSGLPAKFRIDPASPSDDWAGLIDEKSTADLGAAIRAAMPDTEPEPTESNYRLGFNALVVSLSDVRDLVDSTALRGRVLLALGKTEWADIKWNDNTIASKRTLVNSAHLLFTAFDDSSTWTQHRDQLRAANVRDTLLDCSDAHHWADSEHKDRLGNCWTWLRADASLAGLKQALLDFDSRVFVGIQPPDLARFGSQPGTVLTGIHVASRTGTAPPFDYDLQLNPRFVAVIGNKGQGKSALLDCIARGANSSRPEFAFLNQTRFLSPKNRRKAAQFDVEVKWMDGTARTVALDRGHERGALERVEYLPQSFIEQICSSDPDGEHLEAFEEELKAVLFTHISEPERAGADSLDTLLSNKTADLDASIERMRSEVREGVELLHELLVEANELSIHELKGRRDEKRAQLATAEASLSEATEALESIDNGRENNTEVLAAEAHLDELVARREAIATSAATVVRSRVSHEARLNDLRVTIQSIESQSDELMALGDDIYALVTEESKSPSGVVKVELDTQFIAEGIQKVESEIVRASEASTQLAESLQEVESAIHESRQKLASLDQVRELARREAEQQRLRVDAISGTPSDPDSLQGLEAAILRHEKLPELIREQQAALVVAALRILEINQQRLTTVAELYRPAAEFTAESDIATSAGLSFSAELVVSPAWDDIAGAIDLRRAAGLANELGAMRRVRHLSDPADLREALEIVLGRVVRAAGAADGLQVAPDENLKGATPFVTFAEALLGLEWLELRFGLSGNGFSLRELSPGQRGLILLLFYLVLDKRNVPLLLDQPEENLDNETIKQLLVPALRESSSRRQVIVVTHNANLAIVGSADQVVHCSKVGDSFVLQAGSAADATISGLSVDVLEGTWEAFQARRDVYESAVPRR